MNDRWKNSLIAPGSTILEAIKIIDHSALQIVLVVDNDLHLLGTVTDGDIRRGILKGINLEQAVDLIMNSNPKVLKVSDKRENALNLMRHSTLHHIPVVDENYRVVGLEFIDEFITAQKKDNPVLLMAGGLGNRLRPLTASRPKPLLDVGGKPVLETVLDNFIEQGFWKFYISVNYKAEMIKAYFGDGSNRAVQIKYICEDEVLGTAGALGILPEKSKQPLILMNGDILTKIDFSQLLGFHNSHKVDMTLCVRDYSLQIPYGVVKLEQQLLNDIEEKPLLHFLVNAGIYVLNPNIPEYVPPNLYFNMTDLLKTLLDHNQKIAVFPIREYWIDIGHINDYGRANGEYTEVFL